MTNRSTTQAKIRPILLSVGRGIRCRCPNCGKGKLFSGYLQQNANCQECDQPLGRYDAGLLTALLVGLIIVLVFAGAFLAIELAGGASPFNYLTILLPISVAASLVVLRPCKGGLIGFLWALRANDMLQR